MTQVLRYFHQDPKKSVQSTSTSIINLMSLSISSNTRAIDDKLDLIPGKSLSSNDFTDYYKNKLRGIEEEAEVNVQADWDENDSTADSYINNKPASLPASDVYDWAKQPNKPSYTLDEVPDGSSRKLSDYIPVSLRGVYGGVATLGANDGKVPESLLPSYVDDVLEFSSNTDFPAIGESGKIYVNITTNLTYRWTGTQYTEISPSIALGETSSTAYAGDKGKALRDAYDEHAADTVIHITAAERAVWNAKQDAISDLSTIRSNASAAYGWGDHSQQGYVKSSGVTSVAITVPTGLSISGSPITSTGTLALSFANGYSIPTDAKQSNWDTAYSWGNHANEGYLKSITSQMVTNALGYTPPTQDTNTWRPITDTYTGSDLSISVSQYGTNALYNALVNGYANSAGSSTSANYLSNYGYGTTCLSYFQTPGPFNGNEGWCHYIIANHGDGSSYYNFTIGLPFWGVPMYKRLEGGTGTSWYSFITQENIGSQSVSYASSAGNADTVDNLHASSFARIAEPNNMIHSGNEFTFVPSQYNGDVWLNYRTASGSLNGNITKYVFGDGQGHALATIEPNLFYGNITGGAKYIDPYDGTGVDAGSNIIALQGIYNTVAKEKGVVARLLHGNTSMAFGYFIDYAYQYGGFFVANYATPTYVGINNGVWTENQIAFTSELSNYLPLSGGRLTGTTIFNNGCWVLDSNEYNEITNKHWSNGTLYNNANNAVLSTAASIKNAIRFKWYDTYWNIGNIRGGGANTAGFGIALEDTTNDRLIDCLRVTSSNTYVCGNAVWHAGNDGSGSGLDADKVDNLHASSFLRKDTNDSTPYQYIFGSVGIGTTSPTAKLHVNGDTLINGTLYVTKDSPYSGGEINGVSIIRHENADLYIQDSFNTIIGGEGGRLGVCYVDNPSYPLHVGGICAATSFTNTSDIRLKHILSDLVLPIEDIANAPLFLFKWNQNNNDIDTHIGTSAQYWQKLAPELVNEAEDDINTLSLQYDVLGVASSISIAKEVVELKEEIKLLQALIAELKLLLK